MMIQHAVKKGFIFAVVSCALISDPAQATDYTWTGASSANISDTANWSPVPGGLFVQLVDALIFPAGVAVTNLTNTAVTSIASITFQAGAHPYTLSGFGFKFAHVTNDSAANQTILSSLDWQQFSRTYANNGSGTLTLGLIFSTKPAKPLVTQTFNATGDIVVTGGMTANGTPFDLHKTGPGSLILRGTYDYNIGTNHNSTLLVDGGTLDVTDMAIKFEDDNTGGATDWPSLTGDDYTLIDYSDGAIVVNGSAIFGSVTGLSGSDFVLGHDTGAKRVYLHRLPEGTVITIR